MGYIRNVCSVDILQFCSNETFRSAVITDSNHYTCIDTTFITSVDDGLEIRATMRNENTKFFHREERPVAILAFRILNFLVLLQIVDESISGAKFNREQAPLGKHFSQYNFLYFSHCIPREFIYKVNTLGNFKIGNKVFK